MLVEWHHSQTDCGMQETVHMPPRENVTCHKNNINRQKKLHTASVVLCSRKAITSAMLVGHMIITEAVTVYALAVELHLLGHNTITDKILDVLPRAVVQNTFYCYGSFNVLLSCDHMKLTYTL